MFKLGYVIAAMLLTIALASCSPPPPDLERMYAETVLVSDDSGHGSGVLVSPALILTAGHVAKENKTFTVTFADGKTAIGHPVWVGAPGYDMAMLKLEQSVDEPVAPVSHQLPALGEEVYAVGNPQKFTQSMTFGRISFVKPVVPGDEDSEHFLGADMTLAAGMSGGPVFNARGEVVGLSIAILLQKWGMVGEQSLPLHLGLIMPTATIFDTMLPQ